MACVLWSPAACCVSVGCVACACAPGTAGAARGKGASLRVCDGFTQFWLLSTSVLVIMVNWEVGRVARDAEGAVLGALWGPFRDFFGKVE